MTDRGAGTGENDGSTAPEPDTPDTPSTGSPATPDPDVSDGHDFVVVANRLPVDAKTMPDGSVSWQPSPGGLVAALEPVMQDNDGAWIGWTGTPGDAPEPFEARGIRLIPVALEDADVEDFYEGMSNGTLWPLYHDVVARPEFHRHWWDAYVRVNRRFADAAIEHSAENALVWVQDYQLQLVPQFIRERRPDLRIGFFNHIPFPPYEIFAQLPWRRQVLEGLLGADQLGFQRPADANNFLRACRRNNLATRRGMVQLPPEPRFGSASYHPPREVRAASFPISIDSKRTEALARRDDVQERARQIRHELGEPERVLLGVDRLDYTKGILHRLKAVEELFREEKLVAGHAVLVQVATPSRERVEQYRRMREDVEVTVSRINGDHGQLGRPAVQYLHQSHPREELAALYLAADVLLVTALRDGMNLVAKEYVATRFDERGALVLSEFAGAANELPQAFLVNPHDIDGMKAAIMAAVEITPQESQRRMRAMRRRVTEFDVARWAATFLRVTSGRLPSERPPDEGAPAGGGVDGPAATAHREPAPAGPSRPDPAAAPGVPDREPAAAPRSRARATPRADRPGGTTATLESPRDLMVRDDVGRDPVVDPLGDPAGDPMVTSWGADPASALPPDLVASLERFVNRQSLLIGLDFDGVLAPIVTDAAASRALPESRRALGALARLPGLRLALVSGRSLADLRRVAAPPAGVLLVGSHGAEIHDPEAGDDPRVVLDAAGRHLLDRLTESLAEISADHEGTHVETKPTGAVLHTRRARPEVAREATRAALHGPAGWGGVHLTHGKQVVELAVVDTTKGTALAHLRRATGAERVLYAGDDTTDERAFAVLDDDAGDVTVKVGPGDTAARHRLRGPEDVAAMLSLLVDLCRE